MPRPSTSSILLPALLAVNALLAGETDYSPRAVAERAAALAKQSSTDEARFAQLRGDLNRIRPTLKDQKPEDPYRLEAALVERPFGPVDGDTRPPPPLFIRVAARCGYLRLALSDLPHLARLALEENDLLAIDALRRSRDLRAFDVILTLACHQHFEVRRAAEAAAAVLARHRSHRDAAAAFLQASPLTATHPRWWLAELLMEQQDPRGYEELARFVNLLAERATLHPDGTQNAFAAQERIDTEKVLLHCRYARCFAPATDLPSALETLRARLQGPARKAAEMTVAALKEAGDGERLWKQYLEHGFERPLVPTHWWHWTEADATRLAGILEGKEGAAARERAGRSYLPHVAYSAEARALLRSQAASLTTAEEVDRGETVAARAALLLNFLGDPADSLRLREWTKRFGATFLVGLSKIGEEVLPLLESELSHAEASRRGRARDALVGHFFEGIGPRPWHPERHQLRIPDDAQTRLELARILLEPKRLQDDKPFGALMLLLRDDLNRMPARLTDQEYRDLASAMPTKDLPKAGFMDDGMFLLLESIDHPAFLPALQAIAATTEEKSATANAFEPLMPAGECARCILEARRVMTPGPR